MKKLLSLFLAALLIVAALTPALAESPVEITVLFEGCNVTDDTAVLEQLNAYLTEKIGVTVKPVWGTWANFNDLASNAINAGSDEYDVMFTCSWTSNEYAPYAKKGAFVRLDDPEDNLLDEYGKDVEAALPALLLEGAMTEGEDGEKGIYAIPGFKDFATMNCWDVNVTLLEKYGYTLDDVKNAGFYGWGDIFATVKAGEEAEGKTFYPFIFEGAVAERIVDGVSIVPGDANLLLSYYYNKEDVSAPGAYGTELVGKFATPEFEKFAKQMREYFQAGYIDPAIAIGETATDAWRNAQNTANYLISTEVSLYGYEVTTSEARGVQVAYLMDYDAPYIDNTSVQGAMMAISANSAHPVEAMKFLNLLNSDPTVITLLCYGVEGVHYNLNDAGEAEFTDTRTNSYSVWVNGVGNVTLLPPTKGQGADFQQKFAEFYGGSKKLPIYGFTFDTTPVQNEIAACMNIKEAYALTLWTGAGDVDALLPETLSPQAEYILASEAASAGRILLSRSQLATQAQREGAIDHLKRALAACKCSRTLTEEDFLIKDWADLEDGDLAALDACGYQHADCEKLCFDAHDAFSSAYFLELGLPRQQLEARIPSLFTDAACGRVLRVKGFVRDAGGWVELNATADGLTAAPIPAGQEVLIVIGEGLDKERIETVLRS